MILSETTDFETSGANLKPIFLKDLAHHVKETSIAVAPMQSTQPTRTQTPFTNIGNYLIQAACWLSCLADNQFQEVSTVRQDLAASFSSNVQKTWWLDHAASSDLSHQHKPSPTADVKKLLGNSVRQLEIAIEKVTGTSPASIHLGTPTHKIDDFEAIIRLLRIEQGFRQQGRFGTDQLTHAIPVPRSDLLRRPLPRSPMPACSRRRCPRLRRR